MASAVNQRTGLTRFKSTNALIVEFPGSSIIIIFRYKVPAMYAHMNNKIKKKKVPAEEFAMDGLRLSSILSF
jgi:hypothetical protein